MACNWPGKTKGEYLAAMTNILVGVGGKVVVLGEEVEVLGNEVEVISNELGTLEDVVGMLEGELENLGNELETWGWIGSLGMNGFMEWNEVEIMGEVYVNGYVFIVYEGFVECLGVGETKSSNSIDCWKKASSISLIKFEVKVSSLSKVSKTYWSESIGIIFFRSSINWMKSRSITIS